MKTDKYGRKVFTFKDILKLKGNYVSDGRGNYYKVDSVDSKEYKPVHITKDFVAALNLCAPFCDNDISRPGFLGVYIDGIVNQICASTNGKWLQVARCLIPELLQGKLIPLSVVGALSLGFYMLIKDNVIVLSRDGVTIQDNFIEEHFPHYEQVIPETKNLSVKILPALIDFDKLVLNKKHITVNYINNAVIVSDTVMYYENPCPCDFTLSVALPVYKIMAGKNFYFESSSKPLCIFDDFVNWNVMTILMPSSQSAFLEGKDTKESITDIDFIVNGHGPKTSKPVKKPAIKKASSGGSDTGGVDYSKIIAEKDAEIDRLKKEIAQIQEVIMIDKKQTVSDLDQYKEKGIHFSRAVDIIRVPKEIYFADKENIKAELNRKKYRWNPYERYWFRYAQ